MLDILRSETPPTSESGSDEESENPGAPESGPSIRVRAVPAAPAATQAASRISHREESTGRKKQLARRTEKRTSAGVTCLRIIHQEPASRRRLYHFRLSSAARAAFFTAAV